MGWPPPQVREAARRIALTWPDCAGAGSVHWSTRKSRWVADLWHCAGCPTRRCARSERACVRDLTATLAAALHLAEYDAAGDHILTRHRLAGVP